MSRAARATRPKKLNSKQNLPIFRESQVELVEYDGLPSIVETGVEKSEQDVSDTVLTVPRIG